MAFNEDWRAVVGEIALAGLYAPCQGIGVFTLDWDADFAENCVKLLPKPRSKFWVDGMNMTSEDLKKLDEAKNKIKSRLEDWHFVW